MLRTRRRHEASSIFHTPQISGATVQNLVSKSSRRPVFLHPSLKCIQTRTVHRFTTTPLQSPTPGKHRNHFKSVLWFLLADVTALPLRACLQRHSWLLPLRAAGPTPPPPPPPPQRYVITWQERNSGHLSFIPSHGPVAACLVAQHRFPRPRGRCPPFPAVKM